MQRYRYGLLRVPLSPKLHQINAVINAIIAAKAFVSEGLICEVRLEAGMDRKFGYVLALLGHLYCYTYEVLGPRVVIALPDLLGAESAAYRHKEIDVMFTSSDYVIDLPTPHPTLPLQPLPNFQHRHYPPFNHPADEGAIPKYGKVVLGGTFDYLHPGHLILLTTLALVTTDTAYLALTKDELLKNKKHKVFLQGYRRRERELAFVMKHLAPHITVSIFPLSDPVGPAAVEPWDAIILSREVEPAGNSINKIRGNNGLQPLAIVLVDLVQLGTQKMSSTDIRALLSERSENHGEQLQGNWFSLCSRLHVPDDMAKDWWTELIASYSRHDRHYHTLEEIYHICKTVTDFGLQSCDQLELAVWFHRAVFYPERSDNEERSAELCGEFIRMGGVQGCDRVVEYVRATGMFLPITNDPTELLLLDLTLAILGHPRPLYISYCSQIRKECSYRTSYPKCRLAFVSMLLGRDQIYHTERVRERCELTARENLRWEMETIRSRLAQL